MMRLKSKLLSLNASLPAASKVKVFSPRNCEELRIPFKADKVAKVVGRLANMSPPAAGPNLEGQATNDGQIITGVLVENDFKLSLMAAEDLREYAGLTTTVVNCKQRMRLSAAGIELIKWALEGTFGSVENISAKIDQENGRNDNIHMNGDGTEEADEEIERSTTYSCLVMGCVTVHYQSNGEVDLVWEGNMLNDGIADAVMAVLMSVESSPAAVKQSSSKHNHSHSHQPEGLPDRNPHATLSPTERLERLFMFLEAQFGSEALTPIAEPKAPSVSVVPSLKESGSDSDNDEAIEVQQALEMERLHRIGIPVPGITIKVDKMEAKVWLEDLEVECTSKAFGERVRVVIERAVEVVAPLWG